METQGRKRNSRRKDFGKIMGKEGKCKIVREIVAGEIEVNFKQETYVCVGIGK